MYSESTIKQLLSGCPELRRAETRVDVLEVGYTSSDHRTITFKWEAQLDEYGVTAHLEVCISGLFIYFFHVLVPTCLVTTHRLLRLSPPY